MNPLPLVLLTGFLGAGKTTLLNRLLQDPALKNTLVIINEFGEIGLDHLFVETLPGDMLLLSSGCLCCTIRGDLATTLENLIARRNDGELAQIERVILETTGLADPAPILHTLMGHPALMLNFRLDSVITLIDAASGLATLEAHSEARKQTAVADRLVLTKTDLVADTSVLRRQLAALNPTARLLDNEEASAATLLNAGLYNPATKIPDVRRWLNAESLAHRHHHHHDVNRHDSEIRAFCLTSQIAVSPASFDIFLELLRAMHGPNLLRVKGIVALTDKPDSPIVIHGVQHIFHPPVRLDSWPDTDHSTRMVFIVKNILPAAIENIWAALTGTPAIDTPDLAATKDNPLAFGGTNGLLG